MLRTGTTSRLALIAALAALWLASTGTVHAQFGGLFGGGNQGGGGNLFGNGSGQTGNWFNSVPKYREELRPRYKNQWVTESFSGKGYDGANRYQKRVLDGYDRVRVRDGNQLQPNVGQMFNDAAKLLNQSQGNGGYSSGPKYHQSVPNKKRYSEPAPQPVTPAANKLPQKPKKTAADKNPPVLAAIDGGLSLNGSAETDAKQAVEIAEAGGEIDARATGAIERQLEEKVKSGEITRQQKDDMIRQWKETMADGSAQAFEDFRNQPGSVIDFSKLDDMFDYRIQLATYQEGLEKGLSPEEKDAAIAGLKDSLEAKFGTDPFKTKMRDRLENMEVLNDYGKLADLVGNGGVDNPLAVLMQGANNASLPISIVGDVTGLPVMENEPLPDSLATQPATIILTNPQGTGQTVHYTLAGEHAYSMQPGQSQSLNAAYVVAFDPGNGGEAKSYTLNSGSYQWTLGDRGWDLQRVEIKVVIDNSGFDSDFNYVVNNQPAVVKAGQTATHSSGMPIEVRFDRGDGGEEARKLLESGEYKVGVDASGQRIDLFKADEAAPPAVVTQTTNARGARKHSRNAEKVREALQALKKKDAGVESLLGKLKK